jgi:hypothetical protein
MTFFSSTDNNTLLEEGKDRNNFVSLIVNNAGTYSAAITRKMVYTSESYNFFGEGTRGTSERTVNVEVFKLEVIKEIKVQDDLSYLGERIKEIKESKTKKKTTYVQGDLFGFKDINPKDYTYEDHLLSNKFKAKEAYNDIDVDSLFQDNLPKKGIQDVSEYKDIKIDDTKITNCCIQLLTMCPFTNESTLDLGLQTLIDNTEEIYKKRFKNVNELQYWVEVVVEQILFWIDDDSLEEYQEDVQMSIYAYYIIAKLESYEGNSIVNEFINVLERYLV